MRGKIATELGKMGHRVQDLPLAQMEDRLESAFLTSYAREQREKGKMEGLAEARNNAYASIPSMSSGRVSEPKTPTLSPKQREYAEKFGVDPDKAARHVGEEVTAIA